MPSDGIKCEFVGNSIPAYTPEIQIYRLMLESIYKEMLLSGYEDVRSEYEHLVNSDDLNSTPVEFAKNWGIIRNYFDTCKNFTLDANDIKSYFSGADIIHNAYLMCSGITQAQSLYINAVESISEQPLTAYGLAASPDLINHPEALSAPITDIGFDLNGMMKVNRSYISLTKATETSFNICVMLGAATILIFLATEFMKNHRELQELH